ncbi:Ger(x)C family spore germination protein [Bacillus taeanensis]|uniref:Ger(X)C family spore germination protein n=2 Tax=Bacillus taeanensis TaxID=273032 RepID=A0A366XSY5_9BACI|nr:Ger(x)C family spore germination protein [Bacillus taeanensis]
MLMKHKHFLRLFILFILLLLTGCWDRTELQDLDIVTAIGIDKGEDDVNNRYRVTVQIINEGEAVGGTGQTAGRASPITTFSNTGSTVSEALRKISPKTANELYFPHIQVMVIGEELAKEGVTDLFDFIDRDPQFRMLFPILIARENTAENVLKVSTPLESIPASKIVGALEFTRRIWGEYASTRADQVIDSINKHAAAIIGIRINGDPEKGNELFNIRKIDPDTTLEITGIAVLKDGKLETWLDEDAARGVTWIKNEFTRSILNLDCKDIKNGIAVEMVRSKTKLSAEFKEGKPIIHIDTREEGHISEVHCGIDLDKPETINKLEKELEKETKEEIMMAVKAAQEEKSDIFQFSEVVNRADPKEWNKIEKKWEEEIFPELEVKVDVRAFIRRTGMRTKSYLSSE